MGLGKKWVVECVPGDTIESIRSFWKMSEEKWEFVKRDSDWMTFKRIMEGQK